MKGERRKRGTFIRTVLSFLFLFLVVQLAYGAPASKKIHVLKQADGSFFLAQQWGDESSNGWQTIFGYTILHDKDTGNWLYADKNTEGKLIKTTYVVVKDLPPSSIKERLRPTPSPQRYVDGGSKAPDPDGGDEDIDNFLPSASYPKKGTIKVPVILINFDGSDTTYSDIDFGDVIFGDLGDTSVKDYFGEVSYGELIFEDTDVVNWDTATNNHDYYGTSNAKAAELVEEAVQLADAAGFDFSPFDNDGDDYVDGVIVIHQGPGEEESGQDTDIWSHTWSLSAASGVNPVVTDGVTIDTYIICPEILFNDGDTQIITIGVFCHEFGHVLGLPELYDPLGYTQGIGDWGTMAYGCWNGTPIGSSPSHFCAWSKWFLGWVTPTQISGEGWPDDKTTIKAVEDYDTGIYQFLDNPDTTLDWTPGGVGVGEYFLLENRQHVGFDSDLPGTGLLIWHIDESRGDNTADITDPPHKLVDLEAADNEEDLDGTLSGQGDDGDPFPGTENNTAFNFQSDPDNELYDEESSEARVEDIELSDTDILAYLFINKDPVLSTPLLIPDDTNTFFTYKIDYQDDDGDTPTFRDLIIDGDNAHPKIMGWESGSGEEPDGTYSTIVSGLSAGEHTYYFYFDDGEGGVVRMPSSGTYSGPTILGDEEQQQTQEGEGEEEEEKDVSIVQWDCFIATASYGTPLAKEVGILCQFRDRYLVINPLGEKFVMLYYKFSPPIADFISKRPLLKKGVRLMLKPIVKIAENTLSPQKKLNKDK